MLTVGYVPPHCPFIAPQEDFDFFANKISLNDITSQEDLSHPVTNERNKRFQVNPLPDIETQWRVKVAYYGLCRFLDRQVGRVIESLNQNNLLENTIIVYTSDHGEMLGNHGTWWKSSFYDESSKIPLIVSYPKELPTNIKINNNISLKDLGPSILDLVGIEPLPSASGKSFKNLLKDADAHYEEPIFSEFTELKTKLASRMVRYKNWKYIYYHNYAPELFDLQNDPSEKINLAEEKEHKDICAELKTKVLENWDPVKVEKQMAINDKERGLLKEWVLKNKPAEPFTDWFENVTIKNYVNTDVRPVKK